MTKFGVETLPGSANVVHSDQGNLASDGRGFGYSYDFDFDNRRVRLFRDDGGTSGTAGDGLLKEDEETLALHSYDAVGRLTHQADYTTGGTTTTTRFYYDGQNEVIETK